MFWGGVGVINSGGVAVAVSVVVMFVSVAVFAVVVFSVVSSVYMSGPMSSESSVKVGL